MGNGTFNLMISLLPSRIIKLLEFIGFSGNKQLGLQDLLIGVEMQGLRQILCTMTLLSYHLIVCYVLSNQDGDLEFCNELLNKQLTVSWYMKVRFIISNLTLFSITEISQRRLVPVLQRSSRVHARQPRRGSDVVQKVVEITIELGAVSSHLLLGNSMDQQFKARLEGGDIVFKLPGGAQQVVEVSSIESLIENSSSSLTYITFHLCRTMYSYQKASLMCMLNPNELTSSEKRTIDKLMQDVPVYKQRIAGKSLPMEKFAVRRAERYFQTGKLVLPAIELMYLWNLFKITSKKFTLADGIYKLIEKTISGMEQNPDDPLRKFEYDNKALLLLLKGACMRHMKSPLQAIE